MFYRHELTASSNNRSSGSGDTQDSNSNSGLQREGPTTKLLQHTGSSNGNKALTKILVHVNVERSFGPIHVVLPVEDTVGDLIKTVIKVYLKENRRPLLEYTDARCFDLHYSQFSLKCLNPEEKLINLESRNFFLYPKPHNMINSSTATTDNSSTCSHKTKGTTMITNADIRGQNIPFPCTTFMDFLL
ncbi:hypothetical protein DCAR_0206372 [Daucus carota subsp. sativus]|uniref:DUF7054 domain-containing protein n=1 Tax=Daucus carota subsp. sativus TaxID=79200 RepID=A0AAF1AL23_DAUCS|nr:hypothetical protein DCAR_0206372 [Daucus carota subsp. sativus]